MVFKEQELREAKQRAEIANQAKSDFLAMVSHELRTPLDAILGMTQIMQAKGLPTNLKEYVDIISKEGNNLLALVSDILDFVRLEGGRLSFLRHSFDFTELLTQIIHSIKYQASAKHLDLFLDISLDTPKLVIGDPNRVRQILVNLLSNAIKFTEQGSIKVIVSCLKKTKKKVLLEVIVVDTGIGIRKDKLAYVFEKFSQINPIYYRNHQGLGLGLTITKELVEKMGGHIEVSSEYGKGSRFRFELPLQLPNVTHHHLIAQNDERLSLPKPQFNLKILLVEDNLINQKIAQIMLQDLGCQVDIMGNGQEVMEKIDLLCKYQLIFMDIGLSDMSGFDITSILRRKAKLKDIPIVAMTAHILERDRQQALRSGVDKIVAKPISYIEIAAVLKEYFNSPGVYPCSKPVQIKYDDQK